MLRYPPGTRGSDADLCHLAGIAYEKAGEIDRAQTLTTTFRMSTVDLSAYERAGGRKVLMERMAAAVDVGSHALPRRGGCLHAMNAAGCISTVVVRVAEVDATDFERLSVAEREGRRHPFTHEALLRERVPGFAHSVIIGLSHQIGVRETRRVYGEYRLTNEDCLLVARFPGCICRCGAPIEDHRATPGSGEEAEWSYACPPEMYAMVSNACVQGVGIAAELESSIGVIGLVIVPHDQRSVPCTTRRVLWPGSRCPIGGA